MKDRRHLQEGRGKRSRRVGRFWPRHRFLIVCEGEKTEPNYFTRFPIPKTSVIDVRGIGANTTSLVKEALRLKSEGDYDQVWCVFDRDSFPAENFNAALQLAAAKGIRVAYSNEAFELWYLLHFDYLNTGLSRKDYSARLEARLKHPYQKNREGMYTELVDCQPHAIRNAKRLLALYDPPDPANDNPSTTVHLLVEQLNQLTWDE